LASQQFKSFTQRLGLLCLALALSPAWAQKRVALLIGNSNYQNEIFLPNPVRDIALLEGVLQKLGFAVEKLQDQDKIGMDLAINRFVTKSAGADTALVFYAGHGTQPSKGGRSYLLPVNAQVKDDETLEAYGVPAEDIANKLEQSSNSAKLRLVILDACRSRTNARGGDRGLAPPKATDRFTLVAYSTEDNKTADDGKGVNSPYAKALAQQLPRMGKEPVRLVFEATAAEVRKTTQDKQRPRTYGDLESRIGLDGVQLASLSIEPVDAAKPAWEAAQRAHTDRGYKAFLAEYGSSSYAGAARVALAALEPAPQPRPGTPVQVPVAQPPAPVQTQQATETIDGRYQILAGGAEVKDMKTGLVWQRCSVGQTWSGVTCDGKAKTFSFDEAQKLAGTGWRVPGKDELASLIDRREGTPAINKTAFPNIRLEWFWSSSVGDGSLAWLVLFGNGNVSYSYRSHPSAVRLVRASQ
jgi:uncharacterized caspase-like protein